MTTQDKLQKYADAKEKLDEHIKANKPVFDSHEKIVMEVIDAENELRDAVAEDNKGLENGLYKVTVTPQAQRVYDEAKMKQYMTMEQFADCVSDVTRPARISITKLN